MHLRRGAAADGQDVSPPFQFLEQVGILGGHSRVALGDAAVIVGGTVLAQVLVRRAIATEFVAGQFGEEGEALLPAGPVLSEDDDGLVHCKAPTASGSGFLTKPRRKSVTLLACFAALKMKFRSFFNASSQFFR